MKSLTYRRSKSALLLCLGILISTGCGMNNQEIPITTSSEDAKALFIKARDLRENLRDNEARALFEQALEHDLDFALCHYYLAEVAESAVEFQTHLKMAVSLISQVSEGERLLIESKRALAENDPERAIALLEQLTEKYPKDKRAHRNLGYLYRGRNEQKAIAAYRRAIELDKNYAPAWNNLGYAYRRLGDYEKAVDAFKKYIDLLPEEANPYDSIADLYTKMGRYEDAIEYYKKAVERNEAFFFSQQNIGENLLYLGRFNEARRAFVDALNLAKTPSEKVSILQMLAHSYIYQGDLKEAFSSNERARELAVEANLPEWQAALLLDQALVCIEMRDLQSARDCIERCKKVIIESTLSPATQEQYLSNALFQEAFITAMEGDFDRAHELAGILKGRSELGYSPQLDRYQALLGYIYHEQGQHKKASETFATIEHIDPYTLYKWAACEKQIGNHEKMKELLLRVVSWNDNSAEYALVRSKAFTALDKPVPGAAVLN